jgi:hypothetical protein
MPYCLCSLLLSSLCVAGIACLSQLENGERAQRRRQQKCGSFLIYSRYVQYSLRIKCFYIKRKFVHMHKMIKIYYPHSSFLAWLYDQNLS